MRDCHEFRVTPSRDNLVILVNELYRCESQRLANCEVVLSTLRLEQRMRITYTYRTLPRLESHLLPCLQN